MGLTKHTSILSVLETRALRYRNKDQSKVDMNEVLYNKDIGEIGTVDTESISDSDVESWGSNQGKFQATTSELEEISGVADELLEVHGIAH